MSKIETAGHYEAVILGFENVLTLPHRAVKEAERGAFRQLAEATGDTRIYQAHHALHTDSADLSETREQVATVLYDIVVIDDYDEGHPLVTGIVEKRRELYEAAAEAGFDEMVNASSFARNLGNYFLGKTAIVTTAPRDEITPFLRRYKLEEWYPPTHVIGGDDLPEAEPTADTYREMAERLNVSAPEKLLVIDGVPARLLPAKAMGATVVNLMTGTTVKELNRIQGSERIIDYVAANSAILAETLELPVAKPAPILECSQPELQPAQ